MMGYYTRFSGQINITPPLNWRQIKDSPYLPSDDRYDRDLNFLIEGVDIDTEDGVLSTKKAIALVAASEDEMKGYHIEEHLQAVVDAFPEHEFTGHLDCEGEEAGDLWRLKVKDRKATRITPEVVWPED